MRACIIQCTVNKARQGKKAHWESLSLSRVPCRSKLPAVVRHRGPSNACARTGEVRPLGVDSLPEGAAMTASCYETPTRRARLEPVSQLPKSIGIWASGMNDDAFSVVACMRKDARTKNVFQ